MTLLKSVKQQLPRSLRRALRRLLHPHDHLVVSFPKSGRTWLRYLIGRALAVQLGLQERKLSSPYEIVRAARRPGLPLIGFSHQRSDEPLPRGGGHRRERSFFPGKKIVLLVRDPRDVLVSYFHHRTSRMGESHTLSEFVRDPDWGAARSIDFLALWHFHRHVPRDFLLVRYEDLSQDTAGQLRRVLAFVGLDCIGETVIDEAVRYASFDNLRRLGLSELAHHKSLAPTDARDENSFKVRKGRVGGYREELGAADVEWIESLMARRLPDFFGYLPARPSKNPAVEKKGSGL